MQSRKRYTTVFIGSLALAGALSFGTVALAQNSSTGDTEMSTDSGMTHEDSMTPSDETTGAITHDDMNHGNVGQDSESTHDQMSSEEGMTDENSSSEPENSNMDMPGDSDKTSTDSM